MKLVRFLLKLVLLFVVLTGLSIALFLIFPGIQTAVARQFIPADPGVTPQLARLHISMSGAKASGFATTLSNVDISMEEADVRMSMWDLLTTRKAHIQVADVRGAKVDLSRYTPAESKPDADKAPKTEKKEEKEPFKGFLSSFSLPEGLVVEQWKADAEVTLKDGEKVSLSMDGKDLKKDSSGQAAYQVEYHNKDQAAPLQTGSGKGALRWSTDAEGYFTNISGLTQLVGSGNNFPEPLRLNLYLEAKPITDGDAVKVQLSSPDLPKETSTPISLNAEYFATQDLIKGSFVVLLSTSDWHNRLPEDLRNLFANIDGRGEFEFSPSKKTGKVTSSGKVTASGLDRFQGSIPEFARELNLNWQLSAAALPSEVVQIDTLLVEALLPATQTSVTLRPTAQLNIPFAAPDSLLNNGNLPPLKLVFQNVSARLISSFVPEGMQIGFLPVNGEIDLIIHSLDSIAVKTSSPIQVNQLQVRGEKIPAIRPINLTFNPDVLYSPSQIQLGWQLQAAPANNGNDGIGLTLQWQGKGQLADKQFALDHALNGQFTRLQELVPQLPANQVVTLVSKAKLNGTQTNDGVKVTLQSLENQIGQSGQTWLTLSSKSPWNLQTRSGATIPEFENLNLDFLIHNLPLQLVTAFMPQLEASASASGGSFQLRSQGKGWILENQTPLTLQNFSLRQNGQSILQQVNLGVALNGSLDANKALNANLSSLSVSTSQGNVLALQGNVKANLSNEVIPWEFELTSDANLALARQQPLLKDFLQNVLEGRTRITAKGRYQKALDVNAQLNVQNLRGTQGGLSHNLIASVTAGFDPDSRKGSINLPLTLSSGSRVSQLALNGELTAPTTDESGRVTRPGVLNAALKADTIHVNDFLALSSALTPPSNPQAQASRPATPQRPANRPATPATNAQAAPDLEPVWKDWNAQIDMTANKVVLPNQTVVDQLAGEIRVTENRAALEKFNGRIQGAPAQLQAGIDFIPGSAKPYQAKGALNLQNLETAGFFPNNSKPPLNTRLQAKGQFAGNGINLADTVEKLQGQFQVETGEGIIRAFSSNPFLDSLTSTLGGLGQLILSQAKALPPEIQALERLSSILTEIPFQQMRFEVVRGEDLNIQLKEIRVTGNEVQLSGQGLISYRPNTPVVQQPLNLNFMLASRGSTASVFQAAKLIQPLQEGMTAQQFRGLDIPLQLTGSLANINSDAVWNELTNRVIASLDSKKSNNANPSQQQQQQPREQRKPRDPLEGLLKEIFK